MAIANFILAFLSFLDSGTVTVYGTTGFDDFLHEKFFMFFWHEKFCMCS